MKLYNFLLLFICIFGKVSADELVLPYSYIVASDSRFFYFKMIVDRPNEPSSYFGGDGFFGEAYSISSTGEDSLLWRTEGWYSFKVYLSNNGKYLVRTGLWPGQPIKTADLAFAFYENGKLIKSYSTVDLIKNKEEVEYSVSHYEFKRKVEFDSFTNQLKLYTTDNYVYTFSIFTGDIIALEKESNYKIITRALSNSYLSFSHFSTAILVGFIGGFAFCFLSHRFISAYKSKKQKA